MSGRRPNALVLVALLLTGCVQSITGSSYYDGRFWYLNAKTASDIAGGPRQDVLIVVDRNGVIIEKSVTTGLGTLQTAVSGLSTAVINAGGTVAGDAMIRPARNSTSATNNEMVTGTGGTGGTANGGTGGTAIGGQGGHGGNSTTPVSNSNNATGGSTGPITNSSSGGTATTGAVTNSATGGTATGGSTGPVNAVGGSTTTTLGAGASCQGNCD